MYSAMFPLPVPAGAAAAAGPAMQNFPGPRNVIKDNASIHAHLLNIFGLVEARSVHVMMPLRARSTTDGWRAIFDDYFGLNGQGQAWLMWACRKWVRPSFGY